MVCAPAIAVADFMSHDGLKSVPESFYLGFVTPDDSAVVLVSNATG
jgi:hypothetical protein